MIYRARREPVLVGVMVFDGMLMLGIAGWILWNAATKHWPPVFFVIGPSFLLSFAFAAWMILRSSYEIEGADLTVRQGPTRRRIPVATIDEVFPTNNSSLSPAWAKNKLQVLFVPGTKARTLFLDPEDRQAFLQGLVEADPGLRFNGEKVTRGAPV